jgi:O-antigen biosynthesis protein WbqP
LKSIIEFIMALFAIIILGILIIIISIIIKLTSKGNILFKQKRIGKNKKIFNILKFRTMYSETPKDSPTHLLENPDKWITPIGKILRKTSLDELPQLFNILKGDMSFVGPRPALWNQEDLISLRDKYNVNDIKPGLTGWAQVNGRDELPIPIKVDYDKYYYESQSLWLDMKIIFMTIKNIFHGKGIVEGKQ